jgi:hypothetical protein
MREMEFKKVLKNVSLLAAVCAVSVAASANTGTTIFTASISSEGKVLAQSPEWIAGVEYQVQKDYFADYKINFKSDVYKRAPSFCSVSLTDSRSNDDIFYGQARLGAMPKQNHVTVITQLSGKSGPSGDGSQSFMLMCIK